MAISIILDKHIVSVDAIYASIKVEVLIWYFVVTYIDRIINFSKGKLFWFKDFIILWDFFNNTVNYLNLLTSFLSFKLFLTLSIFWLFNLFISYGGDIVEVILESYWFNIHRSLSLLAFKLNIHRNLDLFLKIIVINFVLILVKLELLVLLCNYIDFWINFIIFILEIFLRNHLNNLRAI